jgi:hypothetical protein
MPAMLCCTCHPAAATAADDAALTARTAAAAAPCSAPWAAWMGLATAADAAPRALLPVLLPLPLPLPLLPPAGPDPGGGGSVGMALSAWRASSVSAPKPMHTAHWLPDSGTVLKARPPICTMATCRQHGQCSMCEMRQGARTTAAQHAQLFTH